MDGSTEAVFSFVVGSNPEQLKGNKLREVRSHVSKVGWKAHTRVKGSRNKAHESRSKRRAAIARRHESSSGTTSEDASSLSSQSPPGDWQLGGGRLDPFSAYPGERRAYIPALIDHYLMHMAVDIPELDQPGNKGLLRSSWFPLVISNLAVFQTILLLSASNAASLKPGVCSKGQILGLKADAIQSINECLRNEDSAISDAVIGATAKMAGFEAMHGNVVSYHMHMAGLSKMLELRGGLNALGLGGLLRRIVVWIDLNSAFLLNSPRYFPRHQFTGEMEISEPNPLHFTAP